MCRLSVFKTKVCCLGLVVYFLSLSGNGQLLAQNLQNPEPVIVNPFESPVIVGVNETVVLNVTNVMELQPPPGNGDIQVAYSTGGAADPGIATVIVQSGIGECSGQSNNFVWTCYELLITGNSAGTTTASLYGQANTGGSQTEFPFEIQVAGGPTIANPISDVELGEGEAFPPIDLDPPDGVFAEPGLDFCVLDLNDNCVASGGGDPTVATLRIFTFFGASSLIIEAADEVPGIVSMVGTVRATDPKTQLSTDHPFTVSVAPNQPPFVSMPVGMVALIPGGENFIENANQIFIDPEGDELDFDAHPQPGEPGSEVATAAIETDLGGNHNLLVDPVGLGTITGIIEATDTDGSGETTVHEFAICVSNQPVIIGPVGPFTFAEGDDAIEFNVFNIFQDNDPGEELTFGASSSDESVAKVELVPGVISPPQDPKFRITPIGGGQTVGTFSVSDGCHTIEHMFDITVTSGSTPYVVTDQNVPANCDPFWPLPFGVQPNPITLAVDDSPLIVNPFCHIFWDDDLPNDELTFSSNGSGDSNVATVDIFFSGPNPRLRITPNLNLDATSTTTGHIRAEDTGLNVANHTFSIKILVGIPPNVANQIGIVTVDAGSNVYINPYDVFDDDDTPEPELTFSGGSDNSSVATVVAQRNPLFPSIWDVFVFGHSAGTTSGSITAIDPQNNQTTEEFTIEVVNGGKTKKTATSGEIVPRELALSPNYPNPFNPSTQLSFTVPDDGPAGLKIYNILGQQVAVLFDGFALAGQRYRVTFDASNLTSGIYISRLTFQGKTISRKLQLMK